MYSIIIGLLKAIATTTAIAIVIIVGNIVDNQLISGLEPAEGGIEISISPSGTLFSKRGDLSNRILSDSPVVRVGATRDELVGSGDPFCFIMLPFNREV